MRTDSLLSSGLLKSGLRRFWPLWLAGFAMLVMAFDLPVYTTVSQTVRNYRSLADQVRMLENMWSIMRFVGWLYAFSGAMVVALALNDHLFDSRTATFIGSLPLRRGAAYNTVLASGVVVLVGLPLLAAILLLPLKLTFGAVFSLGNVFQWLAVTAALSFVFYAFALLACQLSGVRAVALLLYLVMNFLPICLEWAARTLVSTLMYGVGTGKPVLDRLSPALWLGEAATGWTADAGMPMWSHIAVYLLVAVLVVFAARVLYQRRDLESAGDSVAFGQIRPVLKYLAGVSMSLLFGFAYWLMSHAGLIDDLPMRDGEVIVLAIMLVIGAFLGVLFAEMIMSRSARVLGKVWRGGMALGCAALVFVGACHYDVFGAVRHVPDQSEVERVALDCDYYTEVFTVSSPEGVVAARNLHQDLISYEGAGSRSLPCFKIDVTYQLKDGTEIVRSYPVLSDYFAYHAGEQAADQGALLLDQLAQIANSQEGRASRFAAVLEADPAKLAVQVEYQMSTGANTSIDLSPDERADFIENALRPDLMNEEAGDVFANVASESASTYDVTLHILEPLDEQGNGFKMLDYLWVSEESSPNTVAWLRSHHPEVELNPWDLTEKA